MLGQNMQTDIITINKQLIPKQIPYGQRIFQIGKKKRDKAEKQENDYISQWDVRSSNLKYFSLPIRVSPEVINDISKAPYRQSSSQCELQELLNPRINTLISKTPSNLTVLAKPRQFFLFEKPNGSSKSAIQKKYLEASLTTQKCKIHLEVPKSASLPLIDMQQQRRVVSRKRFL